MHRNVHHSANVQCPCAESPQSKTLAITPYWGRQLYCNVAVFSKYYCIRRKYFAKVRAHSIPALWHFSNLGSTVKAMNKIKISRFKPYNLPT